MKRIKWIIGSIAVLLITMTALFFIYVSDYYRSDKSVSELLENSTNISVEGDLTVIKSSAKSDTALIFYPGGKVESSAYLPLLVKISESGITCILIKMPFNLAVFNTKAADNIYDKFPEIKHWYLGGHSLGGAMASNYAANNPDKIDGLILLGAYIYGDYPPEETLTVYGTEDFGLDLSKISYDENVYVLNGGNHAQFGNYGKQKGDGDASIERDVQQDLAVNYISEFIHMKNLK